MTTYTPPPETPEIGQAGQMGYNPPSTMVKTRIAQIKQWLPKQPYEAALLLVLGLTGLTVGLWVRHIILDDALITFRVAENLAYGRGFVYNVGERVQVTTTPLYTLVLAGGTWLFGSALRAALVLNITLAALIPMLAYVLGRTLSGRITGVGGALLLTFAPLLIIAFSMESYLYVTLILATMVAYVTGREWLAGILIGLTALVRGDGALLGACILTYDVVAYRRLRWRLIILAITIPVVWYLFALFYYGSPFPSTVGAKIAQGEFNWLGRRFLDGLLVYWDDWIRRQNQDAFYLVPLLLAAGLIPVLRAERRWLLLLGRDILYVAAFVALAVPTAEWYYASLMPGVALLTARGAQFIAEVISQAGVKILPPVSRNLPEAGRFNFMMSSLLTAAILLPLLLALHFVSNLIVQQNPDWKAQVYPDTARWIAANTNASANFATIDIGHLGYWSNRRIIDIAGLAQADVAARLAQGDFGYAIQHYKPDMVLIGYTWLPEVQAMPWFQTDYAPRRFLNFKALNEPLVLFSRRQGVKVQPDPLPTAAIQPLNVDFNRQIRLTGYHLNRPLTPGSLLNLTFYWQVQAPVAVDFTVFTQLIDATNRVVAQKDNKPQNGYYGTPYWQPGEQIVDSYSLLLPADISPGQYTLVFGFYEAPAGPRLQILDEAGVFQSDHVRLTGIDVQAP